MKIAGEVRKDRQEEMKRRKRRKLGQAGEWRGGAGGRT